MPILPALPSRRNFLPETLCGDTRRCVPTCTTRPAARAALTIARPSMIVCPMGFSTYTWAPAFTAAIIGSAMPVVRRRDDRDVGLLLLQHLAIVLILLRHVARPLRRLLGALGKLPLVHVHQRHDLAPPGGRRLAQNVRSPPPAADQGRAIGLVLLGIHESGEAQRGSGGEGTVEECPTVHRHDRLLAERRRALSPPVSRTTYATLCVYAIQFSGGRPRVKRKMAPAGQEWLPAEPSIVTG